MNELEQLAEAFTKLGAARAPAETMAAQLLKRAAQLAIERGVSRETALADLLKRVVDARTGNRPTCADQLPTKAPAEK